MAATASENTQGAFPWNKAMQTEDAAQVMQLAGLIDCGCNPRQIPAVSMAVTAERSRRDEQFLWNRQANGNAFGQDQTPDGTAPAEFRRV